MGLKPLKGEIMIVDKLISHDGTVDWQKACASCAVDGVLCMPTDGECWFCLQNGSDACISCGNDGQTPCCNSELARVIETGKRSFLTSYEYFHPELYQETE